MCARPNELSPQIDSMRSDSTRDDASPGGGKALSASGRGSLGFDRVVAGLALIAVLLGLAGCEEEADEPLVACEPVEIEGANYCVYEEYSVEQTGYDCPEDLSENVELDFGTVCTEGGELPKPHREELIARLPNVDRDSDADVGGADGGLEETGVDSGAGVDGEEVDGTGDVGGVEDDSGPSCEEPESCPSSSTEVEPSYVCHRPVSPSPGEAFPLTIYAKNLAARANGRVEISTDTGFREEVTVDNRCAVTVQLPASVWGNETSFDVTVSNRAGSFQFEVQGSTG